MKESDDFEKSSPARVELKLEKFEGFRYDFYLKRSHRFCMHALHVFTDHFIEFLKNGWYASPAPLDPIFRDPKHVFTAVYTYVGYLRRGYRDRWIYGISAQELMDRLKKSARARRRFVVRRPCLISELYVNPDRL